MVLGIWPPAPCRSSLNGLLARRGFLLIGTAAIRKGAEYPQRLPIGRPEFERRSRVPNLLIVTRAHHLAFCLTRAIGGLESVEKRLRRSRAELPGTEIFTDAGVVYAVWKHLLVDGFVDLAKVIEAARCSEAQFRALT